MGFENSPRLNPDRQNRQIAELANIVGISPRKQRKIMEDASRRGLEEVEKRILRQEETRKDRDNRDRQQLMRDTQTELRPIGRRPDVKKIGQGGRTPVRKIELN